MQSLNQNAMALVSGGDMPLAVFGAAGGAAYQIGRTLGMGELSLTSLAISTVAGIVVVRAIDDTHRFHITDQSIFTTTNIAGMCGYLTSFATRLSDKETAPSAASVY